MTEEQIVRHIHETKDARPDSITLGTPSKGGEVKVYFNAASDAKAIQALVDSALQTRKYANDALAKYGA
jgi:hypothetical protein